MIHPSTTLAPAEREIGLGVVATRDIPRGTITWVRDPLDRRLAPEEARWLGAELLRRYTFPDDDGAPILCWDLARFVNHRCRPNTLTVALRVDVAVRDIAAGEEVSTDYALLNLEEPFDCACGDERCRGIVRPDDAERLAAAREAQLQACVASIGAVTQPLWDRLDPDALRMLEDAIAGRRPLPPVRRHRLAGSAPAGRAR